VPNDHTTSPKGKTTMPFVAGFLRRVRRHRPGRPTDPDYGIEEGEGPVDPGWGVDEGELPEVEPPEPPIGIWPPLTPEHPWRPIPSWPERPSTGPVPPGRPPGSPDQGLPGDPPTAGHLPVFPPGAIWPPLPPGVHGKYLALVLVAGMPGVKYRYVVIDADASFPKPEPKPPEAQPKG
jgi:hypothetical protein